MCHLFHLAVSSVLPGLHVYLSYLIYITVCLPCLQVRIIAKAGVDFVVVQIVWQNITDTRLVTPVDSMEMAR